METLDIYTTVCSLKQCQKCSIYIVSDLLGYFGQIGTLVQGHADQIGTLVQVYAVNPFPKL